MESSRIRRGAGLQPAPRRKSYSATVHSVLPSLPMATSERVAVPPEVVGGTTTTTYVPPLNGVRSVTSPLIVFVHAVAPVAAEIAVSVVVTVPSLARTPWTAIRFDPDRVRWPAFVGSVTLQAVAPVDLMAVTVVVDVWVEVSTTVCV